MGNFTQALKELTGFDSDVIEEREKDTLRDKVEEKAYAEPERKTEAKKAFNSEFDFAEKDVDVEIEDISEDEFFFEPAEGATEISSTMIITGDIKTSDDLLLEGFVIGNIASTGNVKTTGKQIGNLKAVNVVMKDAKQKGNITVNERIAVEGGTIIQGHIKCNDANIDAKVKGNIDAKGRAAMMPEAQIVGNIAADTIKTYPGAKINGSILIRSAVEDFDIDLDLEMGGDI